MNVQSVARISAILNAIARNQGGIGGTALAQQVGLPVSTVSRFLLALEAVNFVKRTTDARGFEIGPGIINLVIQSDFPQYLCTVARPYMVDLAKQIGESVTLCMLKNAQVYCIDQVSSHHNLQLQDWMNQYFPLHTSPDGKVYLAHMADEQRARCLQKPLVPFTPKTITTKDVLLQELARVRTCGYATTEDEYEAGLVSMAAPIWSRDGEIIATIDVSAPSFRLPLARLQDEVAEMLIAACGQIAARLVTSSGTVSG